MPSISSLRLSPPFSISSRLLPSLSIGGASLQLEYSSRPGEGGRDRFRWTLDLPDGSEHSDDDLQSGAGGGSLQQGFVSLLSFLSAAAESFKYRERTGREGDNEDLFPPAVVAWAAEHSDEILMLACELDETVDPDRDLTGTPCPECLSLSDDPRGCDNPGCPSAYWRTPAEAALLRRREADRQTDLRERERFARIRAASYGDLS